MPADINRRAHRTLSDTHVIMDRDLQDRLLQMVKDKLDKKLRWSFGSGISPADVDAAMELLKVIIDPMTLYGISEEQYRSLSEKFLLADKDKDPKGNADKLTKNRKDQFNLDLLAMYIRDSKLNTEEV